MKTLRNFEGIFSQVCVNRETAWLDKPITIAKNAFKFWNSLQLKGGGLGKYLGKKEHKNVIVQTVCRKYCPDVFVHLLCC